MGRSPRARTTASLSESLHQQLNMYALAASAAGVGVLALTQSAEARIAYTPAHVKILPNTNLNLDLNHDGVADFVIHNAYGPFTTFPAALWATCPAPNGVEGSPGFPFFAYALPGGAKIGPSQYFWKKEPMEDYLNGVGRGSGYWRGATNRYLGLRFEDQGGKTHYGWARFTVRGSVHTRIVALLTGYAYETVPNRPIIAGRTKGEADDQASANSANSKDLGSGASLTSPNPGKPQTGSLGALAMGAPGLSIWRRE